MNRTEFQDLADERIAEAKVLLDASKWAGAYYLAGYAIEFALKACISRMTNLHDFPEKKFVVDCHTHELVALMTYANLKALREKDAVADATFATNWGIVKDWDEKSRYVRKTESEARALYDAVADATHGVLRWIKLHW